MLNLAIRIALLAGFSAAAHAAFLFADVEGSAQLNQYSATGTFLHSGSISFPEGLAVSPSGNIFVGNGATFDIEEFNGQTDTFMTTFETLAAMRALTLINVALGTLVVALVSVFALLDPA